MAQINANTRTTILLCLGALGTGHCFGYLHRSLDCPPISRLTQASGSDRSGQLNHRIANLGQAKAPIRELRILSQTFNQMASQLRQSFTALENTKEVLEQRVEERTAALKTAKLTADSANQAKASFWPA